MKTAIGALVLAKGGMLVALSFACAPRADAHFHFVWHSHFIEMVDGPYEDRRPSTLVGQLCNLSSNSAPLTYSEYQEYGNEFNGTAGLSAEYVSASVGFDVRESRRATFGVELTVLPGECGNVSRTKIFDTSFVLGGTEYAWWGDTEYGWSVASQFRVVELTGQTWPI